MDEISNLIKEAKPLYFKKKRTEKVIKTMLCSFCVMLCIGSFGYFNLCNKSEDILTAFKTSNIAEMGLPVDDYGLLTVE